MEAEIYEVRITGVNKERIREDTTSKQAWVVPFKLSIKPDESWSRYYYETHNKQVSEERHDTKLIGDCLEVSVKEVSSLQQALDALKVEVSQTNAVWKEVFLQKKKMQDDLRTIQLQKVETLKQIRSSVDELEF